MTEKKCNNFCIFPLFQQKMRTLVAIIIETLPKLEKNMYLLKANVS